MYLQLQDKLSHQVLLIESIVTNKAKFVGQSLMKSDFRRRFGLFILAIRREGSILREKIAHVVLNAYDTLLVYGPEKKVRDLTKNGEFCANAGTANEDCGTWVGYATYVGKRNVEGGPRQDHISVDAGRFVMGLD